MKKSTLLTSLTTGLALACALGLSACGGSDEEEIVISMRLVGVTKDGLKITNMGGTPVDVPPGTGFAFPRRVPVDSDYDIKVVAQPPNTDRDSCKVFEGKGNTGSVPPQFIAITCIVTTYSLGGSVSGLTGGELVVNNGSQSVTIPKNATAFSMTPAGSANPKLGQIAEGTPYGLTILKQPASGTCTIANPAGIMPAAAVNNIVISCTP